MTKSEEQFVDTLLSAQKAIRDGEWTYSKNENRAIRIFGDPAARIHLRRVLLGLNLLLGA